MEITLKNIGGHNDKNQLENVNLCLPKEKIIGIYGKEKTLFLEIIAGKTNAKGIISFGNQKRTKINSIEINRTIAYIPKNYSFNPIFPTVAEQFRYSWYYEMTPIKNLNKKLKDALKIVGLDDSYLSKNIACLSTSEKKLIQIAYYMLGNPKVILLDEPLMLFDYQTKKYFLKLFQMLKDKYHKTIIIGSNDTNFLYQNTDICVLLKDKNFLKMDVSTQLFEDVPYLLKHQISVPDLTYFTYLVYQNKKRKLSYHKDIRDLIKDIYKHIDF